MSDFEHGNIIIRRIEGPKNIGSMHKIAVDIHRSPNTVMRHIQNHNEEVRLRGYCIKCRRINGRYATVEVCGGCTCFST